MGVTEVAIAVVLVASVVRVFGAVGDLLGRMVSVQFLM